MQNYKFFLTAVLAAFVIFNSRALADDITFTTVTPPGPWGFSEDAGYEDDIYAKNSVDPVNGKVGIGTTTPGEKLDVNGHVFVRGWPINHSGAALYLDAASETGDNGHLYSLVSTGAQYGGVTPGSLIIRDSSVELVEPAPAVRFAISPTGNVGIGTAAPSNKFEVQGTTQLHAKTTNTGAGQETPITIYSSAEHTSGTKDSISGAWIVGLNFKGGTTTNTIGVYGVAGNETAATGTSTNAYALRAKVQDGVGTVTNGYGVYIDNIEGTNDYGVYQSDSTDDNYFAGKVGIGVSSPTYKLEVKSPANAFAAWIQNTATSGVRNGLSVLGGSSSSDYSLVVNNAANTANHLIVKGDGKTGIGTAVPSDKLSIGEKVLISDLTTPPNPPAGGIVIYVDAAGDLIAKNSSGTTKTMANF